MQFKINLQITNKNVFVAIIIGVLPVLATYTSGIPGFTLADVALCICLCLALLTKKRQNYFVVPPYLIIVGMYLIVLFNLITIWLQPDNIAFLDIIIRTVRYFFYLTVIGLCSVRLLNLQYCKKVIAIVSLLATVYIILQYIIYQLSGIILKGYLPFMKIYVEEYATHNYEQIYSQIMYRPTSFFLEPAHYARYVLIGVVLFLFDADKISKKNFFSGVFLSIGILLSTSGQGFFLLMIIWWIFLIKQRNKLDSPALKKTMAFVIIFLPLFLVAIFQIPVIQKITSRVFNLEIENIMNTNTAFGGRFGGLKTFFELPFLYKIIGKGFGIVPDSVWLSSAAYWLYGSGIIVFLIFILYGIICLKRLSGASKYIFVVFMILFFSDDSFYNYMCVVFVSLSLLKTKIEREIK